MAFHWNISVYYSFKIFRRFLLVPIPQLILYYRLALTKFGRREQYTIDRRFDGMFDYKRV